MSGDKACGCARDVAPSNEVLNPSNGVAWVSEFSVPKMDCPSEERMIRLALEGCEGIESLSFDLSQRRVRVYHTGAIDLHAKKLDSLGLGSTLIGTLACAPSEVTQRGQADAQEALGESRVLKALLGINALMFVAELVLGVIAESAGLIADSLDMFADAAVYGLAFYAVGRSKGLQLKAAHLSGFLQIALALGVLLEVVRRFIFGSEPESLLMMGVGLVALAANVGCLLLISKHRNGGAHMRASWIFSANDVLANLGVIVAGLLVMLTGSPYPDLAIGFAVGLLVLNGGRRILAMKA
ncbi:TPA: cation transporter [Pseudomonas aeruginosa]|nr:cation transporter [Pseudomonas aeruginosa]